MKRRAREFLVGDMIWREWLEQEAERRNVSVPSDLSADERAAALEEKLAAKPNPTSAQVREFYEANKASFPGPLRTVEPQIVATLKDQLTNRARTKLRTELQARYLSHTRCSRGYHSAQCGPGSGSTS